MFQSVSNIPLIYGKQEQHEQNSHTLVPAKFYAYVPNFKEVLIL